MTPPIVIVGGGLAGLCCGRELARRNVPFTLLEASDAVGGRARTDQFDGFRLDRGLQNYLTSYPEGRRVLDYGRLDLKPFVRALLVRYAGKFHRLADPRDEFLTALKSVFNPIGSPTDKLAAAKLAATVKGDPVAAPDQSTAEFLKAAGVGEAMTARLFRPFLSSVFLEPELATSARFFRFVFRLFGEGRPSLPAKGIQAIPEQIEAGLPAGSVRLNTRVTAIDGSVVTLATGERLAAKAVVLAVEGPEAVRLSGGAVGEVGSNGTTTLYYDAAVPPVREAILMLDGDGSGPVTSATVLSEVSPEYAPAGRALVAASVVGVPSDDDALLDERVRGQMTEWYGPVVAGWRLLRVYRIRHALPSQPVGVLDPWERPAKLRDGLYVCGDHRDNASINGAMVSGRRAAEVVVADVLVR